jgi:tRNA G46 methylase TrmB
MAQHSRRYDRVAGNYSQYRPRYPDRLVARLSGIIETAPAVSGGGLVLDVGSGTGAFTRRLRAALPSETRIVGIEPSPVMHAQAIAETSDADAMNAAMLRLPLGTVVTVRLVEDPSRSVTLFFPANIRRNRWRRCRRASIGCRPRAEPIGCATAR